MLHTVRVRCWSLLHTVAAVVNVRVPVHVRMGLRQPVHLSADEGCVCVGGGGSGWRGSLFSSVWSIYYVR